MLYYSLSRPTINKGCFRSRDACFVLLLSTIWTVWPSTTSELTNEHSIRFRGPASYFGAPESDYYSGDQLFWVTVSFSHHKKLLLPLLVNTLYTISYIRIFKAIILNFISAVQVDGQKAISRSFISCSNRSASNDDDVKRYSKNRHGSGHDLFQGTISKFA